MLASPESYDLMVRTAGYTMPEFQAWLTDALGVALLARLGPVEDAG